MVISACDFSVYAGWGWNHFQAEDSYTVTPTDYEDTVCVLGFQYSLPFSNSPLALYLRGGAIMNHIEAENKGGEIVSDTGHGIGWQAGAGLDISIGSGWYIRPEAKYKSLSRDMEFGSTTSSVELNYFSAGLGIAKRF